MGKQTKSAKRYLTNKKFVSSKIKSQNYLKQKKIEDDQKNAKLLSSENKEEIKEEQEKLHENRMYLSHCSPRV
jgi:hypothetical protein